MKQIDCLNVVCMWCVCVCLDVGPSPPVVLGSFVPQMMDTSDDAMYWRQHFCYTPEQSFLGGVLCSVAHAEVGALLDGSHVFLPPIQ